MVEIIIIFDLYYVMEEKISENTVLSLLFRAAKSNPTKIYCKSVDHELTYQQFISAIVKLSNEISQKKLKNQCIGVLLPNSILFLIAYFAVLMSGNTPALLNFLLPENAIAKLFVNLKPSMVLSNKELSEYECLTLEIKDYLGLEQIDLGEMDYSCIDDDVGAVLFSGGTTGTPKQINHSHKSLTLMVDRMEWGWPTRSNENWLVVAPFTHIYGFLTGVTNPLLKAGTVFIPEAFDPNLMLKK